MTYATVRAATSPELAYLRTAGQWSKLFLAIFKPAVVYTAMAVLPSTKDRVVQVGFTGGSGTLANVKADMTLYAGSSAGAYDLGIARIRKAPIAGTFYIGETSEVDWQATTYLTVVEEFDLWPKHINTVSDTDFRMDHDITYSNQNSVFEPVPIMGSDRVLKLVVADVSTTFDFSNSYCLGSSISGYSTACATASGSSGLATSTPSLTFDTTGWHTLYLTLTAANGKTSVGVRQVYVYSNDDMPATVFQLGDCAGDYETGGWAFSVTMQAQAAVADVPDRTKCILFAEDRYGSTKTSIGQLAGSENVLCIGKIAEESIAINPELSEVTFRIQGYHYWLGKINGFPTGVIQVTTTPTNWAEMESPTVDKVVYRLLHWGCTATKIIDCYLPGDSRIAAELVGPASTLWAQIQELAFATLQARPGVDRYTRLFVEIEPQLVPVASRTWATVMTLTSVDWRDSVAMQRIVVSPTGLINASGVVVDASGDGHALFSLSPGHVFKHYGGVEIVDRLLLSTQALSNQQAGLLLGWRNNPFPSNEFGLSANNRMIDCFPRQKIAWSVVAADSPRAFTLSGNFIPRRVAFLWNPRTGFLHTNVTLELESVVNVNADGDIPGQGDEVDLSQPPAPPAFPDLPPFVVVIPSDIVPVKVKVLLHTTSYGLLYCADFDIDNPQWVAINAGLAGLYASVNHVIICPNGAIYAAALGSGTAAYFVARAPFAGAPFVVLYDSTNILNGSGVPTGNRGVWAIGYNPAVAEQVAFLLGEHNNNQKLYVGAGSTFNIGAARTTFFNGSLSYGLGKWMFSTYDSFSLFNAAGTSVVGGGAQGGLGQRHIRAGSTGITIHGVNGGNGIIVGTDNGTSFALIDPTPDALAINAAVGNVMPFGAINPTGINLMTAFGTGAKGKSSDYGTSWAPLGSLPIGAWSWAHVLGVSTTSQWIAAGGSSVRMTKDFGTTWLGREGNLSSVAPLGTIDIVKVFVNGYT